MAETVDRDVANMQGREALPRKNGELIFEAPWQARALGMAIALHQQGLYPWDDFKCHLIVLENTDTVHNAVVCTLCSCYPWPVLGLPPDWYKNAPYRSRMVREPRAVLREMGCDVPDGVEVRVWDSSAEARYLVLPQRPAGTDDLDEDALAGLVTRDAMIGVARL